MLEQKFLWSFIHFFCFLYTLFSTLEKRAENSGVLPNWQTKNSDMLIVFYAKFNEEFNGKISFSPFEHGPACFAK